jgi:hypothetical protein
MHEFRDDFWLMVLIAAAVYIAISYLGHLELVANGPPLMIFEDPTIGHNLYGLGT